MIVETLTWNETDRTVTARFHLTEKEKLITPEEICIRIRAIIGLEQRDSIIVEDGAFTATFHALSARFD